MKLSTRRIGLPRASAAVMGVLLGACGSVEPPRELVDARAAYNRAQAGPARQYQPAALREAEQALGRAEQANAASADEIDVRTYSYVAARKSELADVQGQDALNTAEGEQGQTEIQDVTARQLVAARQTAAQKEAEKKAVEERARDELARLAEATRGAALRQEQRGIILTLPGQVLFATGKSALLPGARRKLNDVAEVLRQQADRRISIEGHTDSTGTAATNETLSQDRADAVRQYLVSRGVDEGRVAAHGFGSSQPVASNASPEGRANNRRVEIIVEPAPDAPNAPNAPAP